MDNPDVEIQMGKAAADAAKQVCMLSWLGFCTASKGSDLHHCPSIAFAGVLNQSHHTLRRKQEHCFMIVDRFGQFFESGSPMEMFSCTWKDKLAFYTYCSPLAFDTGRHPAHRLQWFDGHKALLSSLAPLLLRAPLTSLRDQS